uniref:Uncharacterized protein n=1 Tax=Anguilla anguilla TaxID=7936 RepID=A0A0E9S3Z2_ANGAN
MTYNLDSALAPTAISVLQELNLGPNTSGEAIPAI